MNLNNECARTAAPYAVPSTHADRVVTLIERHPDVTFTLHKSYRYAANAHHPTHERGVWGDAMSIKDDGAWEPTGKTAGSAHASREIWLDDLADWAALFNVLDTNHATAILLGRLRVQERWAPYRGRWLVHERRKELYEDAPSRWLLLDIDDIAGDVDDAQNAVADLLAEYIPELDCCGHVISHTASSGIKGLHIRVVFELAESRSLADCKSFAETINARAERKLLDASIYQPARLIFTAAPRLYADVEDGIHTKQVTMPRPIAGRVAWLVPGPRASIPAAPTKPVLQSLPTSKGERLSSADASALLSEMAPGNFDSNIHKLICHLAWSTPEHKRDSVLAGASNQIRERIEATSEPEKLQQRLRAHLDMSRWQRKWDDAVARKRDAQKIIGASKSPALPTSFATVGTGPPLPQTIDAIRAEMAAHFIDAVREITSGKPTHYLFSHPPGTGKSFAIKSAMSPGTLVRDLWVLYEPTHRLAEQACADLKAHAACLTADGTHFGVVLADRVRHHKGRTQPGMCVDETSRPVAERAERMGISPKKAACTSCATGVAGNCPWLKQFDDNDSGVIIKAHANALSDNADDGRVLTIIDEGVFGSVIDAQAPPLDIDDLDAPAIRKLRTGEKLYTASLELHNCRGDLRDALRASLPKTEGTAGVLSLADLAPLLATTTYKSRVNRRWREQNGTGVDALAALETQLQDSLRDQIERADAAGKATSKLHAELQISRNVSKLCAAISSSAAVAGRNYVFGVASWWRRVGGKRVGFVRIVTKNKAFADVLSKGSITLDGTAVDSVWRALVSGKTVLPAITHCATPAPRPGSIHVTHYLDSVGAKSSFVAEAPLVSTQPPAWMALAVDEATQLKALAESKLKHAESVRRKLRADSTLDLIWRFVLHRAFETATRAVNVGENRGVSVLLVTQKVVRERLQALGLPNNVAVEHFGNLRGLNHYKDVPCAIVVGRPRPANIDLELMAEALHSDDAAVLSVARYDVAPRDGRPWLEQHPDTLVAGLQWVTTLAEVRQAVARIRQFDRTPAATCEVHVFGTYDPGVPVDRKTIWADAQRDWSEVALACGALFSAPETNRAVYAGLVPKTGSGRATAAMRQCWDAELYKLAAKTSCGSNSKSGLSPIKKEVETESSQILDSLLGLSPDFRGAYNHSVSGTHKLVKLRLSTGYAQYAIVGSAWTQARLERHMGRNCVAYREVPSHEICDLASVGTYKNTPLDMR